MLFTTQGITFDVGWGLGDDPAGADDDADFSFTECDAAGRRQSSGVHFHAQVDLATGHAKVPPSSMVRPMLEAFLEHGRQGLFSRLRARMADRRRLAVARIDPQEREKGGLVAHAVLEFGEQSVLKGGDRFSFAVEHGGVTWYLEDLHCPSPRCKCQNVRLLVWGPVTTPEGEVALAEAVDEETRCRARVGGP